MTALDDDAGAAAYTQTRPVPLSLSTPPGSRATSPGQARFGGVVIRGAVNPVPAPAAAAAAARSSSSAPVARSANGSHPVEELLAIIRKHTGDKGKPSLRLIMEMDKFYTSETGNTSPHCAGILKGVLSCVADGRAFEGVDAGTHMVHLGKKLSAGGLDFIHAIHAHICSEIRNPSNTEFIHPYVITENGMVGRATKTKAAPISVEDLAKKVLSDVNKTTVMKHINITRRYKGDAQKLIEEAISVTSRSSLPKKELAKYALRNFASIKLSSQNVEKLISIALAPFSIRTTRDKIGGGGTYETTVYSVPMGHPISQVLKDVTWTTDGKTKRFEVKEGKIEIAIYERSNVIDALTEEIPADQITKSSVESAAFSIIYKLGDKVKAVKEHE
jgi:hypothetical protein